MKRVLPIALSTLAGFALITGAYVLNDLDSKAYEPRPINNDEAGAEPYAMMWAKVDARTGEHNPSLRSEVYNMLQHRANRAEKIGLEWLNRGPDNVGGRTRAILELYGKPDTMLVGSVTGGLFISFDGGATWEPHAQFQNLDSSSSIIASIHEDTINNRIYVGTGSSFDAFGNTADIAWPGFGMFVSEDDGITFQHISSTAPGNRFTTAGDPWHAVNRIKTDASGNIYAATEIGFKRSSDFGETWEDVIFLDPPANTIPTSARFADVAIGTSGMIVAATSQGAIYVSQDGSEGSFEQVNSGGLPGSARRVCLGMAPSNDQHIYALYINSNSCMDAVYETRNGGETWSTLLVPHDDFFPMEQGAGCTSGQGVYDACIGVSPTDENLFFLGGVELWRYDGNLTRVASEFGTPPFQDVFANYVHADKHFIYFSPNFPNRAYVTSDGGIAVSENRGATWQGLNKGYISTQFYGIAYASEGRVILGGTQDNGTLVVLGDNANDPDVGFQIFGNDGIDCDMSQISEIVFATSQNGLVVRVDAAQRNGANFAAGQISNMGSGGPFHTVIKLWEKENDLTSRDSIEFEVDLSEVAIDVSNGIVRTYASTVTPIQSAAIVIPSTLKVYSGDQELVLNTTDNTLEGDGEGTIEFNSDGSFDVTVTFDQAPSENSNIYVSFDKEFEANSVLILESNNLNSGLESYQFEHRLENDLQPGDILKVQDPVQSILASTGGGGGGFNLYRNVLNFQQTPTPINVTGVSGSVTAVEFSEDGNYAFVGNSGGTVFRIEGLQDLYSVEDIDNITVDPISSANMGFGGVTGIAIDPSDNNKVIITGGGYGSTSRVKYSTNALSASPTFTNVHGDLPPMPIYDAEIDRNDGNMVLVATEFGVWGTSDVTALGSVEWTDENDDMSYVPSYDIRQQHLPWSAAKNTGMYYVGTHGRGFWETGSLVGIDEVDPLPSQKDAISGLKVYPNPMQNQGAIEFEAQFTGNVEVSVYDINGRQVKTWQERVVRGQNYVTLDVTTLRSGNYFATLQSGESRSLAKFMVLK